MNSNPLPTPNDHHIDRRSHRGRWFAAAGASMLAVALVPAVLLAGGGGSDAGSSTRPSSEPPASTIVESVVESPASTTAPSTTADPQPVSTPKASSTSGRSAKPTTAARTTVKRPTTCASYENRKDIPVQMCDKGDVVELAQEALNAWGAPVDADGYFGPRTDSAVRDFQRAHGLSVDGIVGPATWPILYEYLYAGGDEFDDGSGNTLDEPDGDPVDVNTLDEPDGDPVDEANAD